MEQGLSELRTLQLLLEQRMQEIIQAITEHHHAITQLEVRQGAHDVLATPLAQGGELMRQRRWEALCLGELQGLAYVTEQIEARLTTLNWPGPGVTTVPRDDRMLAERTQESALLPARHEPEESAFLSYE